MGLLTLRFLAELGMLTCLAVGGWRLGGSVVASVVLSGVLPLAAVVVWGRWVAPRASHRMEDPARLAVEVVLFATAILTVAAPGPSPTMVVVGVAVGAAYVVSIPARGREPVDLTRARGGTFRSAGP